MRADPSTVLGGASNDLSTDEVGFLLREIAEQAEAIWLRSANWGSSVSDGARIDDLAKLIASLARTLALKEEGGKVSG